MTAPRLYLITDRRATAGRPLVEVVAAALAGAGADAPYVAVQLREKDLLARPLLELARAVRDVTRITGARLFLNDRIDVALAAEADGVHLGGGSFTIAQARALAPGLAVAVSTHTENEVHAAADGGADFVVFGPVFAISGKSAAVGPEALRDAARACVPIVALGGIEPANADQCLAAGARGIACIRAVMSARDPAFVTRRFLDGFISRNVGSSAFVS